MKKTLICIISATCLVAATAIAAEKPPAPVNQRTTVKATVIKTTEMNARGKVVEISDTSVKIERSIKGNTEVMEFALEKPLENILVNDSVKIDYSVKDGTLTAIRVAKSVPGKSSVKNAIKPIKEKPAPEIK